MGYDVQTRCMMDLQSAHDLHFGSMPYSSSSSGNKTYEVGYVQSATVGRSSPSGWSRETIEYPIGGGAATATTYVDLSALSFPVCDPAESFLDGVSVGWGFGAALIAVACLRLMAKGAR